MPKCSILKFIKELHRTVFTTLELSALSGKSLSGTTQALNYLEKQGVIFKIYRGIWSEVSSKSLSPYVVIPFAFRAPQLCIFYKRVTSLWNNRTDSSIDYTCFNSSYQDNPYKGSDFFCPPHNAVFF